MSMLSLGLMSMLFITSCKKSEDEPDPTPIATAPVANFTFSGNYVGTPTTFTNTSTNATSYSWTFGDGTTSTLTNPTHTFSSTGTKTVTLTATGSGGTNTVTKSVPITVYTAPTIAKITSIKITAFPAKDGSGANWDASDGPDMYFIIEDYNAVTLHDYYTEKVFSNATVSQLPLTFTLASPYQVPSLSTSYWITVIDDDGLGAANPPIASVGFLMSTYSSHPATIDITFGGVNLTLGIQWL